MKDICQREKCYGCEACRNICPQGAIDMMCYGIEGIRPVINAKCIDCKKCASVCPAHKLPKSMLFPKNAYAYRSSLPISRNSQSGGAASCLYYHFIKSGYIVYGVSGIQEGDFSYLRIDSEEGIRHLQKSKYIHAKINFTFREIKQDLNSNNKVLFIGLPCQVTGLYAYLSRDYDNLYTVDLICHGAPSQNLLFEELCNAGINIHNVTEITFRDGYSYHLTVKNGSEILYEKGINKSGYIKEFFEGTINRESCYNCQFAQPRRISDLTVGDFWGLSGNSDIRKRTNNMISVILQMTEKGSELVEILRNNGVLEERPIDEAINGNDSLRHPVIRSKNYYKIRKNMDKGFVFACRSKRTMRERFVEIEWLDKIYSNIKRNIQKPRGA